MNQTDTEEKHGTPRDKVFDIIVNGRQKEWCEKEISFDQVVSLAFPNVPPNQNTIYTITYKHAEGNKPQGTMVYGDTVKVKEGVI